MKYFRIYSATLVNTFGSWCTFLALALLVKERFGVHYVPMVFLVQTLPLILFSRGMVRLIAPQAEKKWYIVIQILFAANSLVLLLSTSLVFIFSHLFVAALLRGLSGPLYNKILADLIPETERRSVFTRVDSLAAGALALAPAAGAWVKIFFSYKALFAIDALSFLVALGLLYPCLKSDSDGAVPWIDWAGFKVRNIMSQIVHRPAELPRAIWFPLILWLAYQVVGSLLNGVEFSIFSVKQLSEIEIGYALAAWGVGNLVTFVMGPVAAFASASLYFLGLLLFIFLPSAVGVIFSFLLAGFAYSALSGGLKSRLVGSVPDGFNPLPVWSYANQLTQFFNLVCYLGASLILNSSFSGAMSGALLVVACGLWFGTFLDQRPRQAVG